MKKSILKTDTKNYIIKEVTTRQAMGALISKEADSMSALRFRMNKADKASWLDMKFLQKTKELLKET